MIDQNLLSAHISWATEVSPRLDRVVVVRTLIGRCFHEYLLPTLEREGATEVAGLRTFFASDHCLDLLAPIVWQYSERRQVEIAGERAWGVHAPGWSRTPGVVAAVARVSQLLRLRPESKLSVGIVARLAVWSAAEVGGDWKAEIEWQRAYLEEAAWS